MKSLPNILPILLPTNRKKSEIKRQHLRTNMYFYMRTNPKLRSLGNLYFGSQIQKLKVVIDFLFNFRFLKNKKSKPLFHLKNIKT
jgi:hypothetical protein